MKEDPHKRIQNFEKNYMNISENNIKMINEDEYKHFIKTKSREVSIKVKNSKS